MKNDLAIGVFDSGVGGVSVLRAIQKELPHEPLIYIADSAHVPYGEKTQVVIQQRALTLTEFLIGKGVKAVVVACNTATAAAIALLRCRFIVPIIGMEPAVKPAASATRTGKVGVLATTGTLQSAQYAGLLAQHGNDIEIIAQACTGLVEAVENGELNEPGTRKLLQRYLAPMLSGGVDTIVLGCTHYAFLTPLIRNIVGPDVTLIDTAAAVARQLHHRLDERHLLIKHMTTDTPQYWTTGDPVRMATTLTGLGQHFTRVQKATSTTDSPENGLNVSAPSPTNANGA